MEIDRLDHFVLTVVSIDVTVEFYTRVLGMHAITFAGGRKALTFGLQKINLHQAGAELLPKARKPTPGSSDFCLISKEPLDEVVEYLTLLKVPIAEGPINRTGATGSIQSVYIRDPDQNLIEISVYTT